MPQLDPSPWFFILTLSWLVLLFIIPLTIMIHEFPNELPHHAKLMPLEEVWAWPWY